MAQYDPSILMTLADRLYLKARSIIAVYALIGLVLGGVVSYFLEQALRGTSLVVMGSVVGMVLGVALGWEKAFWIKVEAQRVLCLMRIEENCRPQKST